MSRPSARNGTANQTDDRDYLSTDDRPYLLSDGSIRHPNRVAPAQWRDPDDTQALARDERGRIGQRRISGFRAIDPLQRLPCEPSHITAAKRFRADWELGSGARSGGAALDRVDCGSHDRDTVSGPLEARRRYQDAVASLGPSACLYVLPVVLSWWTVADLVAARGGNPMQVQGRVMAGLDRLVEHYQPSQPSVPVVVPLSPLVVDGLPADRTGRFKRRA